ncbi:MAG: helix-turn-helix transcriptional regulator [Natronomonas sp.]
MNGAVPYLARSETRIELLSVLAEEPADRRDLRDELDASRTTVSRSLGGLIERQWVTEENNGGPYRLTALGAYVEREFSDLLNAFDLCDALAPLLGRVTADEFDLDPTALADADIVEATAEQPLAPVERAMAARRNSETLREFATVVMRDSADMAHERIENATDNDTVEIVVDAAVVASMHDDPAYSDHLEGARNADGANYYVHDDLPYLLAVLDDRVLFGVVDERGTPLALIESESEAVYEWAEATFERYREEAEPLDA